MKKIIAIFTLSLFALCSAQAQMMGMGNGSSSNYGQAQVASGVVRGQVLSVREVTLTTQNMNGGGMQQMVGQGVGGVLGGIVGQKSGNFAIASVTTMIGMAAGGAMAGNGSTTQPAQEIIYLAEGSQQASSITQSVSDGVRFFPKQSIVIIGGNRIAPAGY
jgi:outer membrane lipoprotein SlyB